MRGKKCKAQKHILFQILVKKKKKKKSPTRRNQRDGKERALKPKGPLKGKEKRWGKRQIMGRELQGCTGDGIECTQGETGAEDRPRLGEWT